MCTDSTLNTFKPTADIRSILVHTRSGKLVMTDHD